MPKKIGDKSEYLTPEELDRLENVVVGDLFFSTFYKILRYSGRRLGEIVGTDRNKKLTGGIILKDVDLDKQIIKTVILKTKKRKLQLKCEQCSKENTYKNKFCSDCGTKLPEFDINKLKYEIPEERYIPLRPEILIVLKTYIDKHKPPFKDNQYLFRQYSLPWLKKIIKIHTKQASVNKNFTLHGFRHCFITNCLKSGMNKSEIMKWTGHKNENSLSSYDRMVPEDIKEKISKVKL